MDTPHTDEAYTDEDDNGATPHGHASARHPNRAGNEKRDKDQALRRLSRDDHARAGETGAARWRRSHPAHATAPTAQLTYWRRRWRYLRASARRRWLYCLAKGNLFLGRQNSEHISVALPECTLRYIERKYPKLPEDNRPLFAQGKVQVIFQLGILNVQWARVKKSVKFLADYREEWSGVEWSSTAEWSSRPS
eukprot:jgi/Tetstr1/445953/TSEL_033580.t1